MSDRRRVLGRRGEDAAEALLRRRGWTIIARNFRCPLGELDLVAEENGVIVFVEVKTRRTIRAGSGAEAVSGYKQLRLLRLAEYFLAVRGLVGRACRFDVVAVAVGPGHARVQVVRDAFGRR